jgi:hypothetical protein
MGPAELFAEIGGMLGLLLGWSILGMYIKSKVQCYSNIVL